MFQVVPQLLQYINIRHFNNKPCHMGIVEQKLTNVGKKTYQVAQAPPLFYFSFLAVYNKRRKERNFYSYYVTQHAGETDLQN